MSRGDKRPSDKPMKNRTGAGGTKPPKPMRDEMAEMMDGLPVRKPNRRRPK